MHIMSLRGSVSDRGSLEQIAPGLLPPTPRLWRTGRRYTPRNDSIFTCLIAIFLIISMMLVNSAHAQMVFDEMTQDTSKPIAIESDTLTVKPEQNMAIFVGAVNAVQGEFHLASDKMLVLYHEEGSKEAENNALSRIMTEGHVKLELPGKWAKAQRGVYDVDKGVIVMAGDVVLTRGPNTLNGQKFVYDVKRGTSKLYSSVDGKATANTGSSEGSSGGRVKGFFVPKKKPGE